MCVCRRERENFLAEQKQTVAQFEAERAQLLSQLQDLEEQLQEKERQLQETDEQVCYGPLNLLPLVRDKQICSGVFLAVWFMLHVYLAVLFGFE